MSKGTKSRPINIRNTTPRSTKIRSENVIIHESASDEDMFST